MASCRYCGNELERNGRVFCGRECQASYNRGGKTNDLRILRAQVFAKTDGVCWWCGGRIEHGLTMRDGWIGHWATVDHIIPKAEGGTDDLSNLVPSCQSCNTVKHKHTVPRFREKSSVPRTWLNHYSEVDE